MSEQHYLTSEGAEKLKNELEDLKGPQREIMAKRLRDAISQGDLSENADYHKAKEDQSFLEGRIQDLEYLLQNAVIIKNTNSDTVQIGATVTIEEEGYTAETYYLVGAQEADPRNGRISNESPIGKALIGQREGDHVEVETPNGSTRIKIIKIE